jgi:hypothetical protein
MRVAERNREPAESHFTEGELDLEPPEELAVVELDDDAILEEDLDNEDVLEQDVDEDTLEVTLEALIHDGDDGDDGDDANDQRRRGDPIPRLGDAADDDAETEAVEDVEAELDVILIERLALPDIDDIDDVDDVEEVDDLDGGRASTDGRRARQRPVHGAEDGAEVAPRGADEFVCPSCFLVRRRVQLAGPGATVCRDCA